MKLTKTLLEQYGYKVVADRGVPQRYVARAPNKATITTNLRSTEAAWAECEAHYWENKTSLEPPTIGGRLRYLRDNKSQNEVAANTGLTASAISMFETGIREPSIMQLYILTTYYGTTLSKFFDGIVLDYEPLKCSEEGELTNERL